jgi:hypothetical protein
MKIKMILSKLKIINRKAAIKTPVLAITTIAENGKIIAFEIVHNGVTKRFDVGPGMEILKKYKELEEYVNKLDTK